MKIYLSLFALMSYLMVSVGCTPQVSPLERYEQAVGARWAGDSKAYTKHLRALAHEAPESRAGRRARATLGASSQWSTLSMVGVVAAVAVPNFMKFQKKSVQSAAKVHLRALATAQQIHQAEKADFCRTFAQCQVQGLPIEEYVFFLDPNTVMAQDTAESDQVIVAARNYFADTGNGPFVRKEGFLIVAVGVLDEDSDLDIWAIDGSGELVHILNDIE